MAAVLVLGAGIIGLNTALRLAAETKHRITVLAADLMGNTSNYAGAFWWPSSRGQDMDRLTDWSLETFAYLQTLGGDAGIARRKIVGLQEEPWEIPPWFDKISSAREATADEVHARLKHGLVVEAGPVIDPPVHLNWLREHLSALGVAIELARVSTLEEALKRCPIVLNCTGLGAKELCHDDELYPASGQLVKIRKCNIKDVIFIGNRPERTAYIVPQPSYTILGGTYFYNDWQTEADPEEASLILERCNQLCPALGASAEDVISSTRALRPIRSNIRLEAEETKNGLVIHNYGQGRSGFSLAYGCAGTVIELLARH